MTLGECMALLAIAGRVYDKAVDPELEKDWAEALADIPEALGITAMRAHVRSSRYFPTIADIREGARAAKPTTLYLPPHVPEPLPRGEIRDIVEALAAKLKGGY